MRVKLDAREIINLVNDWARNQYKTKNVSSVFDLSKSNDVSVDIEVTLSDVDMDTHHARQVEKLAMAMSRTQPMEDVPTLDFSLGSGKELDMAQFEIGNSKGCPLA